MVWDIDPVLIDLGHPIRYYGLFFATGLIGGYMFCRRCMFKEGREDLLEIADTGLTYVFICAVIGMRLAHCLFYQPDYYLSNPLEILKIWKGGYASHGGFFGVIVAVFLFSRKYPQISFSWLADRLTMSAMFCAGCIRMGNFFNSEIVGKPTDGWYGIVFPHYDNLSRHPAQLYESLGYFGIGAILYVIYRMRDRKIPPQFFLGLTMAMAFSWRLLVEFVKIDQESFDLGLPLNVGQWLSIPFILVGIAIALGWHFKWFPALAPDPEKEAAAIAAAKANLGKAKDSKDADGKPAAGQQTKKGRKPKKNKKKR